MRNMGESLKRKVGPLPIWLWAGVVFVLVWYYRNKFSGGTTEATTSLTPTNALPPQDPIPLAPGESVYDPNTGALVNTPGATDPMGGTGGVDIGQAMDDLANAIANGMTVTTQPDATPAGTKAKPTKHKGKRKPKLTVKGAIRAPFGRHKPPAKRGYTTKGLGRGFWEYVPKPKRSHVSTKTAVRSKPHSTKKTTLRRHRAVKASASAGKRDRKRPTTAMTARVVRQRPVASHPTHPEAHSTPHLEHTARRVPPRHRRHK